MVPPEEPEPPVLFNKENCLERVPWAENCRGENGGLGDVLGVFEKESVRSGNLA